MSTELESTSRVVVIKLGGSVLASKDAAIKDIVQLYNRGVPVVVVHGGASEVTSWLRQLNHPTSFVDGERVTDELSLKVVSAVLAGLVNKEMVAAILEGGARAMGISGVDDGLIQARVKHPERGFLGEVVAVNPVPIRLILGAGMVPVIAPVSLHVRGNEGKNLPRLLNVNGDIAAGEIAAALRAQSLVFLTDVDGICDKDGSVIPILSASKAQGLLDDGVANGGMVPKLRACLRALEGGVGACFVVGGHRPHALIDALQGDRIGTIITPAGVSG